MQGRLTALLRLGYRAVVPISSLTLFHLTFNKSVLNDSQSNSSVGAHQKVISSKETTNVEDLEWNWQPIRVVESPTELSPKDIQTRKIICYQMTGSNSVDEQVRKIAQIFSEKYFGNIAQKFQFIFLTPQNIPVKGDQESVFVIFGDEDTKYIALNKYLKSEKQKLSYVPSYTQLMKRMFKQLSIADEFSANNLNEHLQIVGCPGRETYQLLVVPQDLSERAVVESKKVIEKFIKQKEIWSSEVVKGVVKDNVAKQVLGLSREEVNKNQVYLITPDTDNLIDRQNHQFFKIGSKRFCIIPGNKIVDSFLFPPIMSNLSSESYILKVTVDLNQIKSEAIDEICENLKKSQKLRNIPKLLNFSKSNDPIEVTLEKNNYDNIVNVYDPNCPYSDESKRELLKHSHVWKYPHDRLESTKVEEFVDLVTNPESPEANKREEYEYYRSQPQTEAVRKNSKLITGETRRKVVDTPSDKVIFHFSKSCHSCKRFGGLYEELAGKIKGVDFYRIDNDTNKSEGLKNYNSTPVFVMYKKQMPKSGWLFKMPYFTRDLFSNFVEITRQVNVLKRETWENHIEEYKVKEPMVKQTLKEFL